MSDKNGGPAFPLSSKWDEPQLNGMTLRDYFAANATDADVNSYMYESAPIESSFLCGVKVVRTREQAKYAYADKMLEARK